MYKLTLTPEHQYFLDGVIIPGYSQIVQDLGLVDLSRINQADLEYKRQVGTAVHKAIFLYNAGKLDMDSLEGVVAEYFKSWELFCKLYQPKILTEHSEKIICSVKWRYGVTPDILMEVKGGLTVMELKCVSAMSPVTAIQTMAQRVALEETYGIKIKQRWGLQLKPNVMPTLTGYDSLSDDINWKSCVNVWYLKQEMK